MKVLCAIFLFFHAAFCYSQNSEDAAAVFSRAKQYNKPVLLIFSGSDWCRPCIQFEKKILADTAFVSFAGSKIFLLTADFPQHKKQQKSLVDQNESLAGKYNPQGLFPFMVIVGPDEKIIHTITYNNEDAVSFIKLLQAYL
jgi:thioredoxin-related protein